jgi:ATP-dependent DNA helicase RecQ
LLVGQEQLLLRESRVQPAVARARQARTSARGLAEASLNAGALERLQRLKAWRAEVAREHNLPAFVIFHDATLRAIAQRNPQELRALEGIAGMGTKKLQAYGAEVVRVCTEAV